MIVLTIQRLIKQLPHNNFSYCSYQVYFTDSLMMTDGSLLTLDKSEFSEMAGPTRLSSDLQFRLCNLSLSCQTSLQHVHVYRVNLEVDQ